MALPPGENQPCDGMPPGWYPAQLLRNCDFERPVMDSSLGSYLTLKVKLQDAGT